MVWDSLTFRCQHLLQGESELNGYQARVHEAFTISASNDSKVHALSNLPCKDCYAPVEEAAEELRSWVVAYAEYSEQYLTTFRAYGALQPGQNSDRLRSILQMLQRLQNQFEEGSAALRAVNRRLRRVGLKLSDLEWILDPHVWALVLEHLYNTDLNMLRSFPHAHGLTFLRLGGGIQFPYGNYHENGADSDEDLLNDFEESREEWD